MNILFFIIDDMQKYNNLYIPLFEGYCKQREIDGKQIHAKIGNNSLYLTVASTPETMTIGLSNTESINDGEGMIFVYQKEMPLEFWMKGVNYPLDIIFFDSLMNLINYTTMSPGSNLNDSELPIYKSNKPSMFAVEVPGGWCKNKIDNNSRLSF